VSAEGLVALALLDWILENDDLSTLGPSTPNPEDDWMPGPG